MFPSKIKKIPSVYFYWKLWLKINLFKIQNTLKFSYRLKSKQTETFFPMTCIEQNSFPKEGHPFDRKTSDPSHGNAGVKQLYQSVM
jgi:hypothetical protein